MCTYFSNVHILRIFCAHFVHHILRTFCASHFAHILCITFCTHFTHILRTFCAHQRNMCACALREGNTIQKACTILTCNTYTQHILRKRSKNLERTQILSAVRIFTQRLTQYIYSANKKRQKERNIVLRFKFLPKLLLQKSSYTYMYLSIYLFCLNYYYI